MKLATLFGTLCLIVPPAWGEAAPSVDDMEIEELRSLQVSLATGTRHSLRQTPAAATLITAEDIAAMGVKDLDEVLDSVAGVHVSRQPILYGSTYIIRGIGAGSGPINPQVLVLINGVPSNELYTGDKAQTWVSMPLTNVSRIELVRGPGSALYGADAFAGVINIITKSADELNGTRVGASLASFRGRDGWLTHGANYGELAVAAYLQVGKTDGADSLIEADAQTLNDSRFGTHASLAPGPVSRGYEALDAQVELTWRNWRWRSSRKVRDHVGVGAGVNAALDPAHLETITRSTHDLAWDDAQLGEHWGAGVQLSFLSHVTLTPDGLMLFPPGTRLGPSFFPNGMIGGPNRWERTYRLSAYASYDGWQGHALRVGLGHDDMDMYRTATFKNFIITPAGLPVPTGPVIDYQLIQPHILPQRRLNNYAYVQDEWSLHPDWTLTAGVRRDRYSDFGGTTNPRLAVVWNSSAALTAKLLYGQAFRAPSFAEQAGVNPVVNGNPKLKPETIATTEAVLAWQASFALNATLSLFRHELKNLVVSVANPPPSPGGLFQNAGSISGHGAELEMTWDASKSLRATANYAYQQSVDQLTGRDPGYAPRKHAFARLDWRVDGQYALSPQVNWVADRRRAAGDARAPVANYLLVDLALRSTRGAWEFSAALRNLFNRDAREPSPAPGLTLPFDLPLPLRTFSLQLAYKL